MLFQIDLNGNSAALLIDDIVNAGPEGFPMGWSLDWTVQLSTR